MEPTTKRILIACLVIGIVACLCLGVIGLGAGGILFLRPTTRIIIQETPTAAIAVESAVPVITQAGSETSTIVAGTEVTPGGQNSTATPRSSPKPGATGTPQTQISPTVPVPADIASQMDIIEQQVVQLTGWQPKAKVARALLTSEQTCQHLKEESQKDYTPQKAKDEQIVFSLFGVLDKNTDIYKLNQDLQCEQVAGFYDDKTKSMYVVQGQSFGGNEKLTYSHEFTHALQDQYYNFENGMNYNDKTCKENSELCAGMQALIEGDATYIETQWLAKKASPKDILDIQSFYRSFKSPVFDAAPEFLKSDLTFPYDAGLAFVQALIDRGGMKAVNDAFRNPPDTTEQILHPDRYPSDQPVKVTLPDLSKTLGSGWREIEHNEMGEWDTYLILAKGLKASYRIDDNTAKTAAEGWGGDEYAIYTNDTTGKNVLVFSTTWDTTKDTAEFGNAFKVYANDRFGKPTTDQNGFLSWNTDSGVTTFHVAGSRTVWIFATDAAQAELVWQAVK